MALGLSSSMDDYYRAMSMAREREFASLTAGAMAPSAIQIHTQTEEPKPNTKLLLLEG